VAGGILFLSCSSVRACVRVCVSKTLLARYLAEYLTHFHQTYDNDALWDRDERVKFLGQKVKVQGHGGMTLWWNRHCTGGSIQYSTSRVELDFLVFCIFRFFVDFAVLYYSLSKLGRWRKSTNVYSTKLAGQMLTLGLHLGLKRHIRVPTCCRYEVVIDNNQKTLREFKPPPWIFMFYSWLSVGIEIAK